MDPMKMEDVEMPSLRESLQKDIDALDEYFGKIEGNDKRHLNAMMSWSNVREAAISFTEVFDKIKKMKKIEGESDQ